LGAGIGFIEKFRKAYTNFLAGGDVDVMMQGAPPSTNRSASPAGTAARTKQQRAAEALAAKRAKELAALQTKQVKSQKALTAEQKKQNTLKKAGTIFDLEQIQLIAALKTNLSDEDRKRVGLQLALLTGNVSEATKLAGEIAKSQGLSKELSAYLSNLPDAKNPFTAWSAYLDDLAKKAAAIAKTGGATPSGTDFINSVIDQSEKSVPTTNVIPMPKPYSIGSDFMNSVIQQSASNKPMQVVVQIDGKAVASSLQNSSLSGIGSFVDRVSGG
jgi:hypothetical protein